MAEIANPLPVKPEGISLLLAHSWNTSRAVSNPPIDLSVVHFTCFLSSPPFSRREKGFSSLSLRERERG
jgi:hypothetical protein